LTALRKEEYDAGMSHRLHYGAQGAVEIELPPKAWLAECAAGGAHPLDDPAAAVAAALADPLAYPPLAKVAVPGDHVALAVEPGVPQAAAIVGSVVGALIDSGVEPEFITLVLAEGHRDSSSLELTKGLPPEVRQAVNIVTHHPADQPSLCFLGAAKDARPVYLNRAICEADVVIPIGALRLEESLGYVGVHGSLYPTFADEATQQRFRAPISADAAVHQRRRREEADEAAWMLGVQFIVQVVPGPGNSVLHVLAGESHAVTARGQELCSAVWRFTVPRRASLVVAGIEGGPEQQTWENFARALFAASQVVSDEGAIVICSELKCQPGPALRRLSTWDESDLARRNVLRERSADAISASLLVEARERARVYLLSGLEEETVEELGLGHVSAAQEVARLSRQHKSCILLASAQHAVAVAE
jgi:nickel-dependent lactate racemase